MSAGPKRQIRCAIYTRKSSEEGLEQSFNSLDAQREACEAYILSQRQEGWRVVETPYDDGGYSGGPMERPALKQLLADIDARKVDAVVVYKVDRLTRSLADFARIVQVFDSRNVSFVSVTQQFNTTSSAATATSNFRRDEHTGTCAARSLKTRVAWRLSRLTGSCSQSCVPSLPGIKLSTDQPHTQGNEYLIAPIGWVRVSANCGSQHSRAK
jgi:hypothetical protein